MEATRSLAGSFSSSTLCSVFSSEKSTGLTDVRTFGCILIRFSYPNGENFHVELRELSQPRIQRLLTLFARLFGTPILLPPTDTFASGMVRSRNAERESPMPRFLICRIEEGEPVAFLAGYAFRQVQTVKSPLGARQFSDIELAESYARLWQSLEPWALLQIIEANEVTLKSFAD